MCGRFRQFFVLACLAYASTAMGADVSFNRDIRPLLAENCLHCHGPDSATREAGLRLDKEDAAKADHDGVAAIIPGDPGNSELLARIFSDDPDYMMPPPDSGRELSAEDRQRIKQWIQEGAKWQQHWAFLPPQRPSRPAVKHSGWSRGAIDDFVLQKLEATGLQPSPEATREKWLRRVTFDLTGLPPASEELHAFLADMTDGAHERVVDRLLQSPRYGEHMAVTWLDAARYADTDGYQNDGPRTMFRYRDWVIDAYNANMPFDQFTIEQLAGDLLPDATLDQKIATGFNRNHRYNSEAGLVLEEFLLENAVDRVDTTCTVWLGLTMGCARCHDHKYDPFSQREYYQLISFFDNITESGRAIKFGNSEPWVTAPTESQQQQWAALDRSIMAATKKYHAALNKWATRVAPHVAKVGSERSDLDLMPVIPDGLTARFSFENPKAEGIVATPGQSTFATGVSGQAAAFYGKSRLHLGKIGDMSCHKRTSISFWLRPAHVQSGVVMCRQTDSTRRPGFSVELGDGCLQFYIITRWVAGVGMVETTDPLTPGEWTHVVLTNDGSQRARGQQIWLNGKLAETTTRYNTNSNTGVTPKNAVLQLGSGVQGEPFHGLIDELCFYDRTLFRDEIEQLAEYPISEQALRSGQSPETVSQRLQLFLALEGIGQKAQAIHQLRQRKQREELKNVASLHADLLEQRLRRLKFLDALPTSMVMEQRSTARQTHVRRRGVYDDYGDAVESDVPAVFPALSSSGSATRYDFAKWLVSGEHPLTARVAVNRYWQHYFGIGLVATPEDFGVQGELPSHPELLDWLAVEFVRSGWDVKAMQKLIVLSSTYRQSSRHAPRDVGQRDVIGAREDSARDRKRQEGETSIKLSAQSTGTTALGGVRSANAALLHHAERDGDIGQDNIDASKIDPANRLLWRGPRLRLTARQLRDQALSVSGLLTSEIGGPSVSPYQPAKLWDEMSNMKYRQSKGKDLYRRGLYTIWKRTIAPPSLAILDAADRESCVVRPKRTNTPLQALALLNETTFVEAARHLALRMQSEGGDQPVRWLFRTVTCRLPTASERFTLMTARDAFQRHFTSSPDSAHELVSVGESTLPSGIDEVSLAADTLLCNTVLNLDEVITRE